MEYLEITTGEQLRQFREDHMSFETMSRFTGYSVSGLYRAEKSDTFKRSLTQHLLHYQEIQDYRRQIEALKAEVEALKKRPEYLSNDLTRVWDSLMKYTPSVYNEELYRIGECLSKLLWIDDIDSDKEKRSYLTKLGEGLGKLCNVLIDK